MQTTIRAIEGAYQQIDHAIAQALYEHKPVLIQVASNMASLTHPLFEKQPVPFSLSGKMTNKVRAVVAATLHMLPEALISCDGLSECPPASCSGFHAPGSPRTLTCSSLGVDADTSVCIISLFAVAAAVVCRC